MLNKLIIIFLILIITACSDDPEYSTFDGNILGSKGKNSSFEQFDEFPLQYSSDITIKEDEGATTAPLITVKGKMYFATDKGHIISTKHDRLEWEFKLDSNYKVSAEMTSDSAGNIYAVDTGGNLYSLDSDGELRWKKYIGLENEFEFFNVLLQIENNIVVTSSDGKLLVYNTEGEKIYSKTFETDIMNPVSGLDSDTLLVTLSHNEYNKTDTLSSITLTGKKNWTFSQEGFRFIKGAVTNGKIIAVAGSKKVGDKNLSKLFILDKSGEIKWEKEISDIPRFISISRDNEVYMISFSSGMSSMLSGVFAFEAGGELKWKIYYEYSIPMPAFISGERLALLGSNRETYGLFFLKRDDGTLVKTISLGNEAPLHFIPNVGLDGKLIFAGKDDLRVIRITQNPIDEILPY